MIEGSISLKDALCFVVDNRGKTVPTEDAGIMLIATNCINNDNLYPSYTNPRYVSDEIYQNWFRAHPEPGDIILTNKGSKNGAICLVPDKVDFCIAQDMMALRADPVKIDPLYLFAALRSKQVQADIKNLNVDGVIPHFKKTDFKNLNIPLPTRSEQKQIGLLHYELCKKIELNRKTAATLEEMARTLYRSWFVDFDPVHARSQGLPPAHMPPTTAALFPDSFGDDGLPEGWEFKRLGDLVKLNYGKALKKDMRMAGAFPVYGSGGSDSTHNVALISDPTIIVGRKGTVGSVRWAPSGCWPIDTAYYVTSDISLSYILPLIRELPLSEMNTDAAVPGLNRENAYRLEIPFPRNDIIEAFVHLAGGWQAKQDLLTSENQTLATLRDTLLPRLMSGELHVGHARDQIKEAL